MRAIHLACATIVRWLGFARVLLRRRQLPRGEGIGLGRARDAGSPLGSVCAPIARRLTGAAGEYSCPSCTGWPTPHVEYERRMQLPLAALPSPPARTVARLGDEDVVKLAGGTVANSNLPSVPIQLCSGSCLAHQDRSGRHRTPGSCAQCLLAWDQHQQSLRVSLGGDQACEIWHDAFRPVFVEHKILVRRRAAQIDSLWRS